MNLSDIHIQPLNVKDGSREEYAALNRHNNRIRLERLPDDPPIPVEETTQNLQTLPPFIDLSLWLAWDANRSQVIGNGNVYFYRTEENQHLAPFDISVLPEYRQHGLGRHLLSLIAETARRENRRLLVTSTEERIPGGEAFMNRLGAEKGLETHTNQLRMDQLDTSLVNSWLERARVNAESFELGFWDGAYPEEKINAIVELYELTNEQPFGTLEIEDMHMTPEQLRQVEQNHAARGNQRWTYYVVDRVSGKFAGFTETVWNPHRPEILRQDMTGVFPEFRNQGLGRWLKASMLKKVLQERPQVKYIRTGNADSNAAMLKINRELGFEPYTAELLWQVSVQKVDEYLQSRRK